MSGNLPIAAARFLRSWTGFAILAAAWAGFHAQFILNVPRGDDLVSLLPFICDWREAEELETKLDLLFAQYFSHRIVSTRLAALGATAVFGHLHLVALQVIGLVCWIGIAAWCTRQAMERFGTATAGLPIALLLLQPLGHTNIATAMQAVANHGVLVLALATCVVAARALTPAGAAGSLLTAAGAMLTAANGIVLPPLLTVAAALRRQWRAAAALAGGSLVLLLLWFRGFEFGAVGAKPFDATAFAANAFVMLGAPFNLGRLPLPATLGIGALLFVAALSTLWRRRYSLSSDPAALFCLFLLGSVALAAAGRVGWGADYMQQDRYSPYGLLLAASVWVLAPPLPAFLKRSTILAITIAAAVHAAISYARVYPNMREAARWAQAVAVNNNLGVPMTHAESALVTSSQARAIDAGLLRLPEPGFDGIPALAALRGAWAAEPAGLPAIQFLCGFDSGRGVWVLRPQEAQPPLEADFALVADGSRMFLLPAIAERETYLRMLRMGRLVNPERGGFLWPFPEAPGARLRLLGLAAGSGGDVKVLWEGWSDPP